MSLIIIEDSEHAEHVAQFARMPEALAALQAFAKLPWDVQPNRAPCESWKTCGRSYDIVEFDDSKAPWEEVRRFAVLKVSKAGVSWLGGAQDAGA
jgi:hypothetical protein